MRSHLCKYCKREGNVNVVTEKELIFVCWECDLNILTQVYGIDRKDAEDSVNWFIRGACL